MIVLNYYFMKKDGLRKPPEREKNLLNQGIILVENGFREMDGIKNKVGLEIQFGKYAFMGYDIFSKMIVFKNLGYIECGIEIVPGQEMIKDMSTGVSSFDQLLVDFKYRGESNIDIPVLIISIGLTPEEKKRTAELQALFKKDRAEALKIIKLREYNGSPPDLNNDPSLIFINSSGTSANFIPFAGLYTGVPIFLYFKAPLAAA